MNMHVQSLNIHVSYLLCSCNADLFLASPCDHVLTLIQFSSDE